MSRERVYLTFSTELEEIPAELVEQLKRAKEKLQNEAIVSLDYACTDLERHHLDVFENLRIVRENLFKVDQRLAECYNMLAEYFKASADLALAKPEMEQHIPEENILSVEEETQNDQTS